MAVIATPAARVTIAVAVAPMEQGRDARHDAGRGVKGLQWGCRW